MLKHAVEAAGSSTIGKKVANLMLAQVFFLSEHSKIGWQIQLTVRNGRTSRSGKSGRTLQNSSRALRGFMHYDPCDMRAWNERRKFAFHFKEVLITIYTSELCEWGFPERLPLCVPVNMGFVLNSSSSFSLFSISLETISMALSTCSSPINSNLNNKNWIPCHMHNGNQREEWSATFRNHQDTGIHTHDLKMFLKKGPKNWVKLFKGKGYLFFRVIWVMKKGQNRTRSTGDYSSPWARAMFTVKKIICTSLFTFTCSL